MKIAKNRFGRYNKTVPKFQLRSLNDTQHDFPTNCPIFKNTRDYTEKNVCHYSIDVVCNKTMSLHIENVIGIIINDVVNTGLLVIKQNQNIAVNPEGAMVVFICLKI